MQLPPYLLFKTWWHWKSTCAFKNLECQTLQEAPTRTEQQSK